ncbi:MAG: serine/threonine-protein kinase [Phycisphaerae bacterium]
MNQDPNRQPPADVTLDSAALTRTDTGRRQAREGSSRAASSTGHFPPGEVIAGRYRIIERLGAGGMGEVYRADDLTLEQCVALKFLVTARIGDAASMTEMQREVRVARQITHQNVCRVHDLGVWEERPFITMEYIDGEPLSLLLRRIGRLASDKAVDIAQQLCVALAAAHEQGILHRDLKPSNVMIDGRGRVRITDFGLAGVADQIHRDDIRAGTPAYMAPEQFEGKEVTVRSDVYALGLVLYEVFTGKRATPGDTMAEISRWHSESSATPTMPSRIVADLDESVERVIVRCMQRDPALRPASARAVLAALPGYDPLAAALAAGETPSPDLVAAAGPKLGLPPMLALAMLLLILISIPVISWITRPHTLFAYTRLDKPPMVLADRAREMLTTLGYPEPPADTAWGFDIDTDFVRTLRERDQSPTRWDALRHETPPVVTFWYRESPSTMIPKNIAGRIETDEPDLTEAGMSRVRLSPSGRLRSLIVVPPRFTSSSQPDSTTTPDWQRLFEFAGLSIADFQSATPRWTPTVFADTRESWVGHYPGKSAEKVFVEAAAFQGKPVRFVVLGEWDVPASAQTQPAAIDSRRDASRGNSVLAVIDIFLIPVCVGGAAFLAWRNIRLRRGDLSGARRLAIFMFVVSVAAWAIAADHVVNANGEMSAIFRAIGLAAFRAALAWLLYLAIEPFVRKRLPHALVSWTRLLSGQYRDPTVGRDILIGAAISTVLILFNSTRSIVASAMGAPLLEPGAPNLDALLMPRVALSTMIDAIAWSLSTPMFFLMLLVIFLIVLRSRHLAVGLIFVLAAATAVWLSATMSEAPTATAIVAVATVTAYLTCLVRFGLLALTAMQYFQICTGYFLIWFDPATWYVPQVLIAAALLVGIAGWAFYVSLAGRPLLHPKLLDD